MSGLLERFKTPLRQWLNPRQVIVHAHMFKNAGTTLDRSLQHSFTDKHLDHRDDEPMVLFEHALKQHFPSLDLSYQVQNSSRPQQLDARQRREQVLEELGDIAESVIAANRYDIDLYAEVCAQFERSLAQVPAMPSRMAELKRRSELLT